MRTHVHRASAIEAIEGQTEDDPGFIEKIKNIGKAAKDLAIEAKTYVGEIKYTPGLWMKSFVTSATALFSWISYTSLLIIRFMGLSILFVLSPTRYLFHYLG